VLLQPPNSPHTNVGSFDGIHGKQTQSTKTQPLPTTLEPKASTASALIPDTPGHLQMFLAHSLTGQSFLGGRRRNYSALGWWLGGHDVTADWCIVTGSNPGV